MAAAADLHGRLIEAQIVKFEDIIGKRRMRPAQQRAHAADHLARGKRLRDVIISPDIQTKRAVTFLAAGAENDDGKMFCLAAGAQRAADIDP